MSPGQKTKRAPELKVVFDSSALYTGTASDLMNGEVVQLIRDHSNHPDLTLTWCLPEIVMHERRFQMRRRGLDLLPSIEKLEKLLGHNLNVSESIIEMRVKETIERQIQEHSLNLVQLAVNEVDWARLMLDDLALEKRTGS